jgi:hypothetical protein
MTIPPAQASGIQPGQIESGKFCGGEVDDYDETLTLSHTLTRCSGYKKRERVGAGIKNLFEQDHLSYLHKNLS